MKKKKKSTDGHSLVETAWNASYILHPQKRHVTKSRKSIMGEAAIDSFLLAVVGNWNFIQTSFQSR